jgi:hypothetical protein
MLIAGCIGLRAGVRLSLIAAIALAAVTALCCAFISIGRIPIPPAPASAASGNRCHQSYAICRCPTSSSGRAMRWWMSFLVPPYTTNVIGIRRRSSACSSPCSTHCDGGASTSRRPGLAGIVGRKPFVIATFAFFALFPVAVILLLDELPVPDCRIRRRGLARDGEPAREGDDLDMVRRRSAIRSASTI